METLEDMFMKFGCKKVFKKDGTLTANAVYNYYNKVMEYYCNKYNKTEDDFDKFVNELERLGF